MRNVPWRVGSDVRNRMLLRARPVLPVVVALAVAGCAHDYTEHEEAIADAARATASERPRARAKAKAKTKAAGEKTAREKTAGEKTVGEKTVGEKTVGEKTVETKTAGVPLPSRSLLTPQSAPKCADIKSAADAAEPVKDAPKRISIVEPAKAVLRSADDGTPPGKGDGKDSPEPAASAEPARAEPESAETGTAPGKDDARNDPRPDAAAEPAKRESTTAAPASGAGTAAAAMPTPAPAPDTGAEDAAAAIRSKLEYERECYRQAELNVRTRLGELQNSVRATIEAVETPSR